VSVVLRSVVVLSCHAPGKGTRQDEWVNGRPPQNQKRNSSYSNVRDNQYAL
jgi:hypothetical protein